MIPGEELDTSSAKVVYPRRLSRNDEIKELLLTKEKVTMKCCISQIKSHYQILIVSMV